MKSDFRRGECISNAGWEAETSRRRACRARQVEGDGETALTPPHGHRRTGIGAEAVEPLEERGYRDSETITAATLHGGDCRNDAKEVTIFLETRLPTGRMHLECRMEAETSRRMTCRARQVEGDGETALTPRHGHRRTGISAEEVIETVTPCRFWAGRDGSRTRVVDEL
jgi:hypothetical protein